MTNKKPTQTFNQIPTDILDSKELSLLDKLIYGEVFTISNQGNEFFMSNARLAERYNVAVVTVKKSMQRLKKAGLVQVKIQRNEQNMVTKRIVSVVSPDIRGGIHTDTRVVSPDIRGGIPTDTYNRSFNKSLEYIENDFEKLWKLYPNKKGKDLALRAYKKAIKDGTTNKEIQTGIVNLKKEIAFKETEKQYIPHGGTWFNQKRWEDEYETGSNQVSNRSSTVDHQDEINDLEQRLLNNNLTAAQRGAIERRIERLQA